jgi:hypothetical protein
LRHSPPGDLYRASSGNQFLTELPFFERVAKIGDISEEEPLIRLIAALGLIIDLSKPTGIK